MGTILSKIGNFLHFNIQIILNARSSSHRLDRNYASSRNNRIVVASIFPVFSCLAQKMSSVKSHKVPQLLLNLHHRASTNHVRQTEKLLPLPLRLRTVMLASWPVNCGMHHYLPSWCKIFSNKPLRMFFPYIISH